MGWLILLLVSVGAAIAAVGGSALIVLAIGAGDIARYWRTRND